MGSAVKKAKRQTGASERILEAAGEIFAEYGYRHVTIRQICTMAGVNVAAINYHFGDKEGLYKAVLKHWQVLAYQKHPLGEGMDPAAPAEVRLGAFIRSFLFRILEDGRSSWFGKLMAREFIEPTHAQEMLVEDTIRPTYAMLSSIVREMLGAHAPEETVRLACASIVGQCLYFHNARPIVSRLFSQERFSDEDVERIAGHITRFSLGAIKGIAADGGPVA